MGIREIDRNYGDGVKTVGAQPLKHEEQSVLSTVCCIRLSARNSNICGSAATSVSVDLRPQQALDMAIPSLSQVCLFLLIYIP